jgi:hypothetical protein
VFSKEAPLRAALAEATKLKPKFSVHFVFSACGLESDGLLALSCLQQKTVLSLDRDSGFLFRADAQDPAGLLMGAVNAKSYRVMANDRQGMQKMYCDARDAAKSKQHDVSAALDAAVLSVSKLAITVRSGECFFIFVFYLFIYFIL